MMVSFELEKWNAVAPRLLAFVRKRLTDKELARDVVQEVFLRFYEQSHQVRDAEKLTGWIFRIAQNKITDYYREQSRRADIQLPSVEEENRYTRCVATCLKQELADLPEKYREALELAELHTVPQVKIASEKGLSYSGLKSRVQRARDLLRLRMKAKYHIEYDRYGNILLCESRRGVSCPEPNR